MTDIDITMAVSVLVGTVFGVFIMACGIMLWCSKDIKEAKKDGIEFWCNQHGDQKLACLTPGIIELKCGCCFRFNSDGEPIVQADIDKTRVPFAF